MLSSKVVPFAPGTSLMDAALTMAMLVTNQGFLRQNKKESIKSG
jgi:hypothetical protein